MLILAIETSCDETSAAVLDDSGILSNIIATQAIHDEYGGVVPEFASRAHVRQLLPIIEQALLHAGQTFANVDALAVTYGPGLAGSLLVGVCVCKGIALSLKLPWIGVNHIEGHIWAASAEQQIHKYPFIGLVVSGGHSLLVLVEEPLKYRIIGRTIDDAAGEAFDKVAKVLDLGYPGGPAVEKTASLGNENAIAFPLALMEKNNLDFSFSGLKTAVLYYVKSLPKEKRNNYIPDIAASFQRAVVNVLVEKAFRALAAYDCTSLVLAGGVVRNSALRRQFENRCNMESIDLSIPSPELCTDNAAMIGKVGLMRLQRGEYSNFELDIAPNLSLA